MSKPVEDWELSAYLDGDLQAGRSADVEAALSRSPELRRHLDALAADHRALRQLAEDRSEELGPPPARLNRLAAELSAALPPEPALRHAVRPAQAAWRQVAALATAAALGWGAASWAAPQDDPLSSFVDEAAEVHRVSAITTAFSREASAPVIDNLGRLFAHRLTPPDLSEDGYLLGRVDIAATDTGPAAVFVYTGPDGRRVSLILSLDSPILEAIRDNAAPRVTTHDGLAVSFGEQNGVAYALVGPIPEPSARLLAMRAAETLSN